MKRRYAYLTPFSHNFGAACLIPGTSYVVQAFPSKLLIYDIEDSEKKIIKELSFATQAPLKEFTLLQDLERGYVSCFSEKFRVNITPELEFLSKVGKQPIKGERLCLGAYKKQEVENLRKRLSMAELFPLLFRLGNQVKVARTGEKGSVFALLEQCRSVKKPEEINAAFKALFLGGFSSFLLPRKEDSEFHNLYTSERLETPILALLAETALWIRSLFFISDNNFFHFLPSLPPECVFGKMFALETEVGTLDFEWSKKEMRGATLHSQKGGSLEIRFPPSIKSYRLKNDKKEWRVDSKTILEVKENSTYFFDRFEK